MFVHFNFHIIAIVSYNLNSKLATSKNHDPEVIYYLGISAVIVYYELELLIISVNRIIACYYLLT